MLRSIILILGLVCGAEVAAAEDVPTIKGLSPNGRFALRVTDSRKADLIEKASGKVVVELGEVTSRYREHPEETLLVWSSDSKWAAYGTRGDRHGDTRVYFWNGSEFEEIQLP